VLQRLACHRQPRTKGRRKEKVKRREKVRRKVKVRRKAKVRRAKVRRVRKAKVRRRARKAKVRRRARKAKVRRRRQTKEKVKELVEGKTAGDTAHPPALQGVRQAKVEERKLGKEGEPSKFIINFKF
jgi:hypothetical protein